jgi:hypothetical protein
MPPHDGILPAGDDAGLRERMKKREMEIDE